MSYSQNDFETLVCIGVHSWLISANGVDGVVGVGLAASKGWLWAIGEETVRNKHIAGG